MARKRTALEIDAEIAKLTEQREESRKTEKPGVVARIKAAIAYYDITAADLGLDTASRKAPGPVKKNKVIKGKVKPAASRIKFKDDAGHTWSGFGRKPRWFTEALANGKTVADLLVA